MSLKLRLPFARRAKAEAPPPLPERPLDPERIEAARERLRREIPPLQNDDEE